jgi:hypothetical protein
MSFLLAVLIYLAALGVPIFLLYWFGSQSWYLHAAALAASIGLGFLPIPTGVQGPLFDLIFGFTFVVLLVWGAGGIIFLNAEGHHGHHAKHA